MDDEQILCKWLPNLIYLNDFNGNWKEYEEFIYKIFKVDFIDSRPYFLSKPVNIRKHPQIFNKEQAFFHITSVDTSKLGTDPNDRIPDLRRCERIKWPRKIIENYTCEDICNSCNKIKIWHVPYKMYKRVHLLFEDYKFLIIIEEREYYNLLISAFYIEHSHTLRKKLKEYEKYRAKNA